MTLYYVLRNFRSGSGEIARMFKPLGGHPMAQKAIAFLREDFSGPDNVGPMRVASFLGADGDEALRADVVAYVAEFLNAVG